MALESKGPGGVSNAYGIRTVSKPSQINSAEKSRTNYTEFSRGGGEPVTAVTNPLTGGIELMAGGVQFAATGGIDIRSVGAKCDGQAVYDAAVTGASAGSMTITSTSAVFSTGDVGKSCVHAPKTATGNYSRYGFITAVNSANSVTVSLSGITTGTLHQFVWGTDDTAAVNVATAVAAQLKSPVFIPSEITTCTGQIVVPTGVTMFGVGNATGVGFARDFEYYNSSLVLTGYIADAGGFVKLGNNGLGNTGANFGTRGSNLRSLNVDGMNNASSAVGVDTSAGNATRGNHIFGCTILRGTTASLTASASSVTTFCVIINQQRGVCVNILGDSRFVNNFVYGSAAGAACIKTASSDVEIFGNHIWKDSDSPSAAGPCILLDYSWGNSSVPSRGSVQIQGNQFDTSFGPHIKINISASTMVRNVNVNGNIGFQNDNVPNATYPCIELVVGAGSSLRALSVVGNTFNGSWNDNTKGQYTCMIDGVGIAGTLLASSVVGNVADNCAVLYSTFTPTYSAGNHTIAGAVATVVVSG
jgi:hypothetical protein